MIILSNKDIEKATNGKWINKTEELIINRVVFILSQIKEGDLYFPYDSSLWEEDTIENNDSINKAFDKGAVAIVLPKNTKIKSDKPILLVEHLRDSFREFALSSTKKTKAKKVLVTGSFGKTGFKKQLYTLIKDFKNTFAFLDSANQSLPIYKSLTSIPIDSEVVIVEVAAPGYNISKKRSRYVKPDIAVITNIGPEHLKQHGGSIENVIENKSRVAYGLNDNGIMIIPNQKEYNTKEKMTKYIHKINPTIKVMTFGDENSNAFILNKKFSGLGWDLKVRINSTEVSFTLPFLEEYSVQAILPILLVCDNLGLELNEVVTKYKNYNHFPSSGNFYSINFKGKSFYLYDQSIRGILNGYKETLKVIEQMKPKESGKKIALFSEFINFDESGVDIVDSDEFKYLFKKSGLKSLFTINKFCEHINVLDDKNIWKEHKTKIEDILDIVIDDIDNNDILFIRATQKSRANKLVNKILNEADSIKQYY